MDAVFAVFTGLGDQFFGGSGQLYPDCLLVFALVVAGVVGRASGKTVVSTAAPPRPRVCAETIKREFVFVFCVFVYGFPTFVCFVYEQFV